LISPASHPENISKCSVFCCLLDIRRRIMRLADRAEFLMRFPRMRGGRADPAHGEATKMPKTSHVIIDTTGAGRLHQCYTDIDSVGAEHSEATQSADWHQIGWSRAIYRWDTISTRVAADCEIDDRDIIDAESAASAYRAIGKPVPPDLAGFLEIQGVAMANRSVIGEDVAPAFQGTAKELLT
jgi:hypothetical protein